MWLDFVESCLLKAWVQDIVARWRMRYGALNIELGIELERIGGIEIELRREGVLWGWGKEGIFM